MYEYTRRRKKRKTGRLWVFLILVLLIIMGAALYQGHRWITGEMTAEAQLFMERVASGDEAGARAAIDGEDTGLGDLITLFQEEAVTYTVVSGARITGLYSGNIDFNFTRNGYEFSARLVMIRRNGGWFTRSLPEIKLVQGAFVKEVKGRQLHLLWEGQEKTFDLPAPVELEHGAVINARLVGDTVITVDLLEEVLLSRLLRRSETEIEGEVEGSLPLKSLFAVYLVKTGSLRSGTPEDLHIGIEKLTLAISGGEITAVKVERSFHPRSIRVVLRQNLHNHTRESLLHRRLQISGESSFILEDRQNNAQFTFPAGTLLLVEPSGGAIRVTPPGEDSLFFENRIFFNPGENGRLLIRNLERNLGGAPPAYRGVLDLANMEGQLVVVNELSLEQYLYTVVPSEMPLSFGPEALKAQAVAARSYAYTGIFSGRFSNYGAHVDDSVLSQVYNNYPEDSRSTEAVEATAGLVLFYGQAVVDARYFSTSCGYTANYHNVWHDSVTNHFPADPVPYLKAASQVPSTSIALNSEVDVREFLRQNDWPAAYDLESPYFRWRVLMTGEELEASINHNLGERYEAQPSFVLTLEGGEFHSMEVPRNPLGRLLDVRVVERGEGGNIMVLEVEGTNGTYRIIKEYNIRFTVRPVQYLPGGSPVVLELNDGSKRENNSILPSAFAELELIRDGAGDLEQVIINGGGYGHGVGMSQYGARGMNSMGYSFTEILSHYYPGSALRNIYD